MKILQVVRQYLPSTGGMETYVSSLCRELSAAGHDADVATLDYLFNKNERLPAYQRLDSIDVIRLPSAGNPRYFLAPRLLKLLPRYDLVHVHGVDFFVDLLGSLREVHGKPVVLSTHGGFFHTPWLPAFKLAYFHTITRLALKGVDRVIASSPKDEQLFLRVTDKVTLVNNGVDYGVFADVEKKPEEDRLIFIGRVSRNKGVDRLLEALAALRRVRPQATLVVVGPDWEGLASRYCAEAVNLGLEDAVSFTGELPREQMLAELAKAKLFVSASEYEAFGISLVEAMASGTVPVANRIPAFEGIITDGRDGFLTDFSQPDVAAERLQRALEMRDEQLLEMGARARDTASGYDWKHVAGEIVEVYKEVLEEGGVGHLPK
jgi:alpha-1,3-mannosyltransferase